MLTEDDTQSSGPNDAVSPWPLDRSKCEVRLRTRLPSTKQALNFGVDQVLKVAENCCKIENGKDDLEIALREALANALIHGNAFGSQKRIRLRCYAGQERGLLVVIGDEGPGFDPEEVPDPRDEDRMHLHHGRGLFLMRELMDYVEHRKGGKEIVLYKHCAPKDAAS